MAANFATDHAMARIAERLTMAGETAETIAAMRETAERYAARCRPFESVAVRIARVAFTGSDYGETSNGDTVVAIIRGRIVQTYMLRRRQQPFTRTALSVDRTVAL